MERTLLRRAWAGGVGTVTGGNCQPSPG